MANEKKYLNLAGLNAFLNNLKELFASKTDVITNAEIDEVCGGTVETYLESIAAEEVGF